MMEREKSKDKLKFVYHQDLGVVDYKEAWDLQTKLHNELKSLKLAARKSGGLSNHKHYLLFAEHNHVFTLGKSGKIGHLLIREDQLDQIEAQYYKINRGGDITYHGKGQITAYPIFDMDDFYHDVHKYVRNLEEVVIDFLAKYKVLGERYPGYTGVWVKDGSKMLKICAIGVHLSRWVTMHGIALNINTDLDYYDHIIPCGIKEEKTDVTSLSSLLGHEVDFEAAKKDLLESFITVFQLDIKKGQ